MLLCQPLQAQNKKKKKKYKKKSDANLIARAYNDVTTRNNYLFNANLIYKDILSQIELENEWDFNEILPLYFHQNLEDFTAYQAQLETIIEKTSIVMSLHDNTRWKDDSYLLLGKARYLNGDYYEALRTFRFVVTTMKKDIGKQKSSVDNKAKLKAAKAKEAAKKAKERKKEMAAKKKEMQDRIAQLKKDKQKEIDNNNKNRQKEIKQKIKAKEKIIALRKKGKEIPQKLLDLAYGKKDDDEELVDAEEEKKQEEEKKAEEEDPTYYRTDFTSDRKEQKKEV